MRVKALKKDYVDVELEKSTVDRIVRTELLKLIGFESYADDDHRRGVYVEGGNVVSWWEEGGGSHSWFEDKTLRKATELDIRVFAILDELKKKK